MKLTNQSIICFAGEDWWFHNPHSNLHIMQALSSDNRILFVNSPGIRMPDFRKDRFAWKRVVKKLQSFAKFVRQAQPNIWVVTPVASPAVPRFQGAMARIIAGLVRHLRPLAASLLLLASCGAFGEELLHGLFSDHMVMQRGVPVPVWGWADPGDTITVSIDGQTKTGRANGAGKWMVRLDPMQAGAPRRMTVRSRTGMVEVNDILLGEVWIASGQSNMSWPLKLAQDAQQEMANASHPEIRVLSLPYAIAPKGPSERLPPGNPRARHLNAWLPVSPAVAGEMSAVALFFARDVQRSVRVPVGIIVNAIGGTPIEAWISRDGYLSDPEYKVVAEYYDGIANHVENTPEGRKEFAELSAKYDATQAELRAAGKPALWPPRYPKPMETSAFGSTLYNALVHPLLPYAIRGVIWYQGEAQADRAYEYRGFLPLLINDWRSRWGQGEFPFIYVQLPNFGGIRPEPGTGAWAFLRESQLLTLRVPKTAMAVSIELGEAASIHPANKQDVGKRLALAARGVAYGEKIVYSGPIFRKISVEGRAIRVAFDHPGDGLMAGRKSGVDPVVEDRSGKLQQFAIAGRDMKFVWADAVIDGDTVVVSSPSVIAPVAVRYAWANNPEGCNLYNRAGLPASPFRSDQSPPGSPADYFRTRVEKGYTLAPR